ncbi:serine/threonine-protein kinase [Ferrimonas pelagia]|uniref:Serine/threonine-protein kinase n=1 Tax=Ferrimonas pelagia TaxID=1177826 RepID=A0ABP9EZ22_9GAMM
MNGPHSIGDVVGGRYIIQGFLGEGGMQYVYLADDQVLGRQVALKTPKNNSAEKRFHRSAIVSARVNHPNIAKTLDYIESDTKSYLIEEVIYGDDMQKALLQKVDKLDPFLCAKVFHHLSKGLAASHHVNVLHRDLKPTNVMVSGGINIEEIKITDFGVAKLAEGEIVEAAEGGHDTISASATAVGALPYMAPEVIDTPREVTLKADVWSLGAMMYELICGKKPFGTGLRSVSKILEGKYDEFPEFITSNRQFKSLSEQLINIIEECLQVDPVKRPTADQLVSKCSTLCYPVCKRLVGNIKNLQHNSYGFIFVQGSNDVFYHRNSVYGDFPSVGEPVMFSKFAGGRADRAYPLVKLKS